MLATEVIRIQFSDLAVQQLVHGVKRLGLRGAAVGASVAGDEFSDRKFHRFWAKAEELGVLIFISSPEHARPGPPVQGQRLAGQHHRQPARRGSSTRIAGKCSERPRRSCWGLWVRKVRLLSLLV